MILPDGRHCCPLCQTFYTNKNSFKMHCETIHGPEEYFKCRLCDAIIRSKAYFRKHISQKHFKGGQKLCQTYGIRVNKSSSSSWEYLQTNMTIIVIILLWWKKSKQIFVYILQNCITTAPPPAVLAEVEAKIIQLQFNNYLLLSHLLNIMVWIFPPIPTMMMNP